MGSIRPGCTWVSTAFIQCQGTLAFLFLAELPYWRTIIKISHIFGNAKWNVVYLLDDSIMYLVPWTHFLLEALIKYLCVIYCYVIKHINPQGDCPNLCLSLHCFSLELISLITFIMSTWRRPLFFKARKTKRRICDNANLHNVQIIIRISRPSGPPSFMCVGINMATFATDNAAASR